MIPAKPSASIVASAIVAIIGSLLVMLIAGSSFFVTLLARNGALASAQPPGVRTTSLVILAGFGAFGILGIFSAVGVWRLQNWARLSFLIYSGVMIFISAIGLGVVWFVLPKLPSIEPRADAVIRVFMLIVYGIPIAIGVWWLILFTRKGIAQQFQAEPLMMEDGVTPVPPKPACPLPIAILAGFSLISVFSIPLIFLMPTPIPVILFGHAIFGRPGLAIFALLSLTLGVSAVGLLLLRKWSYPLAIGCHLFWCISGTVSLLNPNSWTVMNGVLAKMRSPGYPGSTFSYGHNQFLAMNAGGLVLMICILVLLLYYRTAFYEQSDRKRNWNSIASLPTATSPTPPALAP
jgi:hypothetical protein